MARTAPVPNIPPIPGMCPSVAVLAGGPGGAGGGGDGDANGNGDGPGNGDGSGDGANGDGSGAGACGEGAGATCTNCSSGTSAGDPVDGLTGEVFTVPKTDLFLPGPFNLKIDRRYSSFARRHDVGLGWGWTHSLAWAGVVHRDRISIRGGTGEWIDFPVLEVGESASIKGWGLLRAPEGYVLRPGNEFFHFFSPQPKAPQLLQLTQIRYRNLGAITLGYDGDKLRTIQDAAGRTVVVEREPGGRIASLAVPAPDGQSLVFARYAYHADGTLAEAVDADRNRWSFDYDDDKRLIRMHVPQGPVYHYAYDRQGRCVETWGAWPGGQDPALDPDAPKTLVDGTPAKGIHHAKLEFLPDGLSEVVDSVRRQRFFSSESGKIAKAVNGKGAVTTRRMDDAGNVIGHTDANGALWSYQYDELGLVVGATDPENRSIRMERDGEGRLLKVVDPRGNTIEYLRDPAGHVTSIRDQAGGVRSMRYDARGLLSEDTRVDGSTVRYAYDAHGNVVRKTLPNGAFFSYQFDHWGRLRKEVLPDGRTFEFEYAGSGLLTEVVDGLGRRKSFAHDALGNLVSESLPDGTTTRFLRGGLGWLAAIEYADGSVVRRYHNREGWPLRVVNEAGETFALEYGTTGVVSSERGFDGVTTSYVRDARDRVVQVVQGGRKTVIERNKVGQPLKYTGHGGAEKTFLYDSAGDLVSAACGSTGFEWRRDALGRVVQETHRVGEESFSVAIERDALGRRVALETSLGTNVRSPRNVFGDVSAVLVDGSEAEAFERDTMGWMVRRMLPGGAAIVDELDGAARVRRRFVDVAHGGGSKAGEPEWLGAQRQAVEKSWQYTPISEVASVTTAADGTTEFTYDLRRNLLSSRGRTSREEFRYDTRQNPHVAGVDAPARRYGLGSRLESSGDYELEHDAWGRVIAKAQRVDGTVRKTRFTYDDWDLLRAVDLPDGLRVELDYDAYARRVRKRVLRGAAEVERTTYVWSLLHIAQQVVERRPDAPVVTTYFYEDESQLVPLGHADDQARVHYVHSVKGTPEELVDDAGALCGRATSTAFGKTTWSGRSTPFRFPGQLADDETGLHYNRYRTYDPDSGRFLTRDPIGVSGEFNPYAYGPNPIGWSDPMGLQHHMDVRGPRSWHRGDRELSTDGHGREYDSGFHGLSADDRDDGVSHELNSRARCHTEQRFAHDLIAAHEAGEDVAGRDFALTGRLPPCPNCHRALQHAADRTGANITYSWDHPEHGRQTITYGPDTPPRGTRGDDARALVRGYRMDEDDSRRNGYRFRSWGSASSAYTAASAGIP